MQNKLSISTIMCKIMSVQTLSNLWSAGFGLKLNSPNIPKLEYLRSIEIIRVQVCFRNTFASTAGRFKEFMSIFHGWCCHLLFFHSVPEVKTFCTCFLINVLSYLQKSMWLLNSKGSCFRQKKSIAKTVALNCISLKAYRVTHHVQTHKCYLRKPNSKKCKYPIQSNAYLGRKSINWNQWTTF